MRIRWQAPDEPKPDEDEFPHFTTALAYAIFIAAAGILLGDLLTWVRAWLG